MVIQTVAVVAVMVLGALTVALWAFRPGDYRTDPRAGRVPGFFTAAWVIFLPVAGAAGLSIGTYALAAGEQGAWQNIVIGAVAIACWPVTLLALRRRRAAHRNL